MTWEFLQKQYLGPVSMEGDTGSGTLNPQLILLCSKVWSCDPSPHPSLLSNQHEDCSIGHAPLMEWLLAMDSTPDHRWGPFWSLPILTYHPAYAGSVSTESSHAPPMCGFASGHTDTIGKSRLCQSWP